MNVTNLLNQFPDGKIPVWYDAGHRKYSEDEYENDGVLYDVIRTTCAIEDAPRVAAEMMWKPGIMGERPFEGLPPRATSSPRNIFISRLIEDGIERQMAVVGAIYPKRKRGGDEGRAAGHEHETTCRAAAEQLDTYPVKCVRHWQEYHLKVFRGLRRSVRQDLDLSENGAMPPIDELNGVYLALDAAVRSLEVRLGKKHSKTLDQ